MKGNNLSKIVTITSIAFLLFVLDRIIKYIAKSGQIFDFWIFKFKYTPNPYIAFSLPVYGILLYILVGLGIFFIINSLILEFKNKDWLGFLGFNLILVGAMSNLLDRILTGVVIDYFVFLNISIFNLSDIFIFCGIVIAVISIIRD